MTCVPRPNRPDQRQAATSNQHGGLAGLSDAVHRLILLNIERVNSFPEGVLGLQANCVPRPVGCRHMNSRWGISKLLPSVTWIRMGRNGDAFRCCSIWSAFISCSFQPHLPASELAAYLIPVLNGGVIGRGVVGSSTEFADHGSEAMQPSSARMSVPLRQS